MDITQLRPIDLSLAQSKPPLIAVSPTVSIQTALTVMNKHHFTSLPIFSHDSTKVISIVNLFDILLYLVGDLSTVQVDKFPLDHPVENVLGLDADRESYRIHKTNPNDKLLDTLRVFACGGHRSLVVDETDETRNPWMLSQTDIIRHIVHHPDCISNLIDMNATIQDLGFVDDSKQLTTVQGHQQTALYTYRLMAEKKLSGIPILDEQGQFLGDLCLEDLPGANLDMVDLLDLPCVDYLKELSHHNSSTAERGVLLKEIIDKMVKSDTHRVWILDGNKVIGVITMSDIMGRLCSQSCAVGMRIELKKDPTWKKEREHSSLLPSLLNMTESIWSSSDEKPFHCIHDELVKKNNHSMDDDDSSGLRGFIQNPYLFGIALFSSLGGLLFGYDQGIISGLQDMENFKLRFPMTPVENGFVVSILELGAWLGTYLIAYLADKISRKYSIAVATVFFLAGSALQAGAQKVIHLLIGRFVAGLGVGALSMLGPLYQSELSSPGMRGSMVSLYQLSITIGVAVSFWIDYGTSSLGGETSWRLPLYLQMVFGLILLIGVFFLPFSPRWLMKVGREHEALEVLARLRRRTNDDLKVVAEWKEIKVAVEFDHLQPQGGLFSQGMWRRVLIGVTLLFFQQLTGVNAIIYYAPSIVSSVGLTGNSSKLLATGVIGVIMVCCCIPTVLFLDRIGRRTLLLIGSVGMWLCMTALGALVTAFQSDWAHHSFEGWVAVSMIYLFMGIFAFSWGPCVWVISSELFPLRVRAKAMGITSSSHWMNNFIVGLITPPLLALSPPATYFMFSGFCFLSFCFVWFLVPETRGYSLEDMDGLFGGQAAVEDATIMKKIRQDVDDLSMNFKTPVV